MKGYITKSNNAAIHSAGFSFIAHIISALNSFVILIALFFMLIQIVLRVSFTSSGKFDALSDQTLRISLVIAILYDHSCSLLHLLSNIFAIEKYTYVF
ncbi:MAG: hypothetical protein U9Q66_00915 [Patescibacteria group bacterium]|nr:hypothetical protein [Patescibacteria group bacterium]